VQPAGVRYFYARVRPTMADPAQCDPYGHSPLAVAPAYTAKFLMGPQEPDEQAMRRTISEDTPASQ